MMTASPAGADARPVGHERVMRWLRVFPGVPAQVAEVRQFVAFLLDGCPAREALVSCASELSANAVVHTASGDGGFFTVEVSYPRSGLARVSVTDAGGPTKPAAGAPVTDGVSDDEIGDLPTCGLGLALVAGAASRWGYTDVGSGRTVWAEAAWPVPFASETSAASHQPRSTQTAAGGRGGAALVPRARRAVPHHPAPHPVPQASIRAASPADNADRAARIGHTLSPHNGGPRCPDRAHLIRDLSGRRCPDRAHLIRDLKCEIPFPV